MILWFQDGSPIGPEPKVRSGFWSIEYGDWFDSEAASNSLTEFLGNPTHWINRMDRRSYSLDAAYTPLTGPTNQCNGRILTGGAPIWGFF